jgi:maltooligosyltrehalose synthase
MLATATHDHKRGEDVRARLAVLSEIPDIWEAFVDYMESSEFGVDVDPGDRLMILQTIVGAFPYDRSDFAEFADRVIGWSRKAVREAKLRSSWTLPNETYEASCASYISNVLRNGATRSAIEAFVDQIGAPGAVNALTQTLLKYTLPGVPDCYQGCDLWDLSLVDPDNRRPVDFAARQPVTSWADHVHLAQTWKDGRIKQALIARLLALRLEAPDIFVAPVEPLPVRGARSEHVVAFRRRGQTASLFVIAPLRCASGVPENDKLSLAPDWLEAIEVDLGAGLAAPEWMSAKSLLRAIPLAFFLERH